MMATTESKSAFYLAAEARGKGVAYMCARASARSPITADYARSRGEVSSIVAPGYDSLHQKALASPEASRVCDAELIALLESYVLRIFIDETSSFRWLMSRLQDLESEGRISEDDYEITSFESILAEQKKAGRQREFLSTFTRALFSD